MENSELINVIRQVMQEELKPVKDELTVLKDDVATIKSDIVALKDDVTTIKSDSVVLKGEVAAIKADMGTKIQQDENNRFIQSLLHNTEELQAQFEGFLHTTITTEALANLATKEDISKLNAKFEVLNSRLFQQEAELYELKAVK